MTSFWRCNDVAIISCVWCELCWILFFVQRVNEYWKCLATISARALAETGYLCYSNHADLCVEPCWKYICTDLLHCVVWVSDLATWYNCDSLYGNEVEKIYSKDYGTVTQDSKYIVSRTGWQSQFVVNTRGVDPGCGHNGDQHEIQQCNTSQIAKFMGPTWGPPGSCRPQVGPVLASWTLLSGIACRSASNITSTLGRNQSCVYIYPIMTDDPAHGRLGADVNAWVTKIHELLRVWDGLDPFDIWRGAGHGNATVVLSVISQTRPQYGRDSMTQCMS